MISTEEWRQRQTEEYALLKEKEEEHWHITYDHMESQHIKDIDALLCEKGKASYQKLVSYSQDSLFRKAYANRALFAAFFVMMEIAQQEYAQTQKTSILDNFNSMKELSNFLRTFRFLIWRIEFGDIGDTTIADETFYKHLQSTSITPLTVGLLTIVSAQEPQKMLLHLTDYMLEKHQLSFAIELLEFAHAIYPEHTGINETWQSMQEILNTIS